MNNINDILPNELFCHIISMVPQKNIVACVCRRWKDVVYSGRRLLIFDKHDYIEDYVHNYDLIAWSLSDFQEKKLKERTLYALVLNSDLERFEFFVKRMEKCFMFKDLLRYSAKSGNAKTFKWIYNFLITKYDHWSILYCDKDNYHEMLTIKQYLCTDNFLLSLYDEIIQWGNLEVLEYFKKIFKPSSSAQKFIVF